MKDDFIVPLNGLAQGKTEFFRSVGKEFFERFGNSEILAAGLDVRVVIEKSSRFIGVDCEIQGDVTVTCDRCLGDLRLPVSTGFALSVKFGDPDMAGEAEGEREIVVLPVTDTDLDLSQTVYDYICLSLPVQRVHEDGECDPETVRFLSSEDDEELIQKDSSTPFAGLGDLLGMK